MEKEEKESIRGALLPRSTTMKRKLTLDEIGRCHPSLKGKKKQKGRGCLPDEIYSSLKRSYGQGGDRKKTRKRGRREGRDKREKRGEKETKGETSLYVSVGCAEGADHCILDKASGLSEDKKKELRTTYLRPRRPSSWQKKPNMWLDNFNIQHVMEQYQVAYPWFHFLGVFPIDFSIPDPYRKNGKTQCLNQEICALNVKEEYRRGIRGIGMVFNLDPHDKGGSHWVALWIDLHELKEKDRILAGYFDSYGYEVPEMIGRFMRSLQLQVKECVLGYNARRFQYGGSECGMFSIYFLICMIHGIPFQEFCKDALHDRSMLELRSVLFGE
jgi:hypothetical protein